MVHSLAFSPCPNDTFIFDALIHQEIDTGDHRFAAVMADVQTLNEWALEGKHAISKISYGVWPLVQQNYRLLEAGGALGFGVGPLLISREPIDLAHISQLRIAIPGINTTAHLLFSLAFPEATNKTFCFFHEVEGAVLDGTVDAGVIIHENRFTYQEKGLVKLLDLGAFWEEKLQCPIPLGGIVVRKDLPESFDRELTRYIQQSIRLGWSQYPELSAFIRENAQEMSEEVMQQHIQLYVNDFSLSLGEAGKKAVKTLVETYYQVTTGPR